jgi:hypothetical protein
MMNLSLILSLLMAVTLLQHPIACAWTGEQDDRSIDSLRLMLEAELAEQATEVCAEMTAVNKLQEEQGAMLPDRIIAAYHYLDTIRMIAREKNGQVPAWFSEMWAAGRGTNSQICRDVRGKVTGNHISEAVQEAKPKRRKSH